MFEFELTSEVINLPSLLADRWKDVARFKEAKNVQDVINLIKSIMRGLDCYVDLHDFIYSFEHYDKVVTNFEESLVKNTELVIYDFELRPDKKIYRNSTNIVDFFETIWETTETGFDYHVYYAGQVDVWLLSIENISTPHDTKTSLDSIYFMLDDVKAFEQKYNLLESNNEITNQESKEPIREVEVIKEIDKPQPYLDINHPNYSSRLAICIDVWNYLFLDGNYDNKVSIKENISRWNKKTNQQLELSDSLINAMQSILNFDNGVDRTGKLLKGYIPKIQKK
ncbi:hypothetical protein [Francisella philomiragia]|uniref:hypothetical protein n=1 Tax=Francisella philomiragia TaxID=28110 RepID=UPI0022445396|nr:hypothetical protein [Francisella philomiragia]